VKEHRPSDETLNRGPVTLEWRFGISNGAWDYADEISPRVF